MQDGQMFNMYGSWRIGELLPKLQYACMAPQVRKNSHVTRTWVSDRFPHATVSGTLSGVRENPVVRSQRQTVPEYLRC